RYRARRKPRPPRYPSLRLRFDPSWSAPAASSASLPTSEFEMASHQALALDCSAEASSISVHGEAQRSQPPAALTAPAGTHAPANVATPKASSAKILEFPRFT